MADLRQGNNGKWTIKNLYHNKPGVEIPATFAYNGQPVSFVIESSPKTVETPWETSLGTSINLADIDRRYTEVVDEAACKKYVVRLNIDEHFTIKPYQEDPYIFQLSPQSIELESTATTQTFTVTATNVSDIGWDSQNSVNVTAGAANSTSATANFTQNTSTTESKSIVFAISGKTSGGRTIRENAAITLKKKGPDSSWNFVINKLDFESGGGTAVATIYCNSTTTWTINISGMQGNWLHIPTTAGTGSLTQTITIDEYTGTSINRTAEVTASDGNQPISYTIKQNPRASDRISLVFDPSSIDADGGSVLLSVACNTYWTLSTNDTWITLPETTGSGNTSLTIQVPSNGSSQNRTFTVSGQTSGGTASDWTTLTQYKPEEDTYLYAYVGGRYDYNNTEQEVPYNPSGSYSFHVNASHSWKVDSVTGNWVHIQSGSMSGDPGYTPNAVEYTVDSASTERTAYVYLSLVDYPNVTATFEINQVNNEEMDVTNLDWDAGSGHYYLVFNDNLAHEFDVVVTANCQWSIASIKDEYGQSYPSSVISCRSGQGPYSGNRTLTFDLAANEDISKEREIYITLRTSSGEIERIVYVSQAESPYVRITDSTPALVDGDAIFENSGVTYTLTIESNVNYSLANVPEWLTAVLNANKTQLTLTPKSATSSVRNGTIDFVYAGVTYATLDVQQNADAPEPVDNPEIFLYDDPNGSYHKTLEFTRGAAAQDVIFYVSSNGIWWMYECDENITVTDEYGNPVGTSESEGEAPTGLLNKRKMKAHIEANLNDGEQSGKRTLNAKFQTTASLWTRYDYAYLEITQFGNTLFFTEPQITNFQLFESPDCDGNYYRPVPNDTSLKPEVYITIRIHDAAGTVDYREDVTARADTSYLDPSGLVNSRLSISYPTYDTNTPPRAFVLGPSSHYNPGGGNEHNPYALEVNAYSGYPGTSVAQGCGEAGQPARCGELVLTYQGDTERVTASTQIKQYYCEKPYPDLDFHFSNGADATAITNNTLVSFTLSKPTGTEVVYQFQPSFSDPTAYIKLSQSGYDTPEDFWEEHTISSSSSAEYIYWYLVEGAGHFHVNIYAYDKNTPGIDKTLSLDVN